MQGAVQLAIVVSIPGRDLGVLELFDAVESGSYSKFQSLEGIWGFWNLPSSSISHSQPLFQSLEGIWGFWNLRPSARSSSWGRLLVSIPGRDLGVLELHPTYKAEEIIKCFNPWKGFGGFGTS